jgi:hypothetical protein
MSCWPRTPVTRWTSWACDRRDANIDTVVGKTGVVTLEGTGVETVDANIAGQGGDIIG